MIIIALTAVATAALTGAAALARQLGAARTLLTQVHAERDQARNEAQQAATDHGQQIEMLDAILRIWADHADQLATERDAAHISLGLVLDDPDVAATLNQHLAPVVSILEARA